MIISCSPLSEGFDQSINGRCRFQSCQFLYSYELQFPEEIMEIVLGGCKYLETDKIDIHTIYLKTTSSHMNKCIPIAFKFIY